LDGEEVVHLKSLSEIKINEKRPSFLKIKCDLVEGYQSDTRPSNILALVPIKKHQKISFMNLHIKQFSN